LDIIEKKWTRIQIQASQEVAGLMMREEKQEVLTSITITHQSIHLGKHAVAQVHLLLERIRERLGWTSYKDKLIRSSLLPLMVSTRRMKM
jgi:hypothetical protein